MFELRWVFQVSVILIILGFDGRNDAFQTKFNFLCFHILLKFHMLLSQASSQADNNYHLTIQRVRCCKDVYSRTSL